MHQLCSKRHGALQAGGGTYAALDAVGGATTQLVTSGVRPGGTILIYGALSGPTLTLNTFDIFLRKRLEVPRLSCLCSDCCQHHVHSFRTPGPATSLATFACMHSGKLFARAAVCHNWLTQLPACTATYYLFGPHSQRCCPAWKCITLTSRTFPFSCCMRIHGVRHHLSPTPRPLHQWSLEYCAGIHPTRMAGRAGGAPCRHACCRVGTDGGWHAQALLRLASKEHSRCIVREYSHV